MITETAIDLDEHDFTRATRTQAWTVDELLFHLLLDAQRALVAFPSNPVRQPDVFAVSYWRPFRPVHGDGGAGHAGFVRISASAYSTPESLVNQWRETSTAVVRAAIECRHDRVATQSHVLTLADFIETLIVEATVHYLDLTLELPAKPPPHECLLRVRSTLDGLLGQPLPIDWSDTEYALKGTGRRSLSQADFDGLGVLTNWFPLLG